jgi:DNA-binding transcriptional MerR regulator
MTAQHADDGGDVADLLTIDELALRTGLTVRTTRYYASLGLLPPPVRRGRMAYYGPAHLGRLGLIRALQDHGFTLAAIERHLASVPMEAGAEELAVHRALLTAWRPSEWETLDRSELERRVGRTLDDGDLEWLVRAGAVRHGSETGELHALPLVCRAVEVLDLGLPIEAILDANSAVRRHMSRLADDLAEVLHERVVRPYLRDDLSMADAERLERTLDSLRALTLDAIVTAFQRSANDVVARSLSLSPDA